MSQPAQREDNRRRFAPAVKSERGQEPCNLGLVGPPGGGKTASSLLIAEGIRKVRPGPIVLIDTERGRSRKYSPAKGVAANPAAFTFDFLRADFEPPFRFHDMLEMIHEQLKMRPAAVIVDSLSDCQEGEGGHLDWHDDEVKNVGGNEWAAWSKPSASRRRFVSGILQILTPLIFTFRARERTEQQDDPDRRGKKKVVNIGWMPVAPLEIVHALDLCCLLPPRANGVPVWSSAKVGTDFVVKLPHFLRGALKDGPLTIDTGEAIAKWASGGAAPVLPEEEERKGLLQEISDALQARHPGQTDAAKKDRVTLRRAVLKVDDWKQAGALAVPVLRQALLELQHPVGERTREQDFEDESRELADREAADERDGKVTA